MRATVPVSLLTAVGVQLACQGFKVVFYSLRERRLALSWFVSAGGMPSAHSAFVSALAVSVGLWSGFASDLFAVATVFSIIIIYDAWRLRGAVEHHARLLAELTARRRGAPAINQRLGHTLPQLAAGIVVGGAAAACVWLLLRAA